MVKIVFRGIFRTAIPVSWKPEWSGIDIEIRKFVRERCGFLATTENMFYQIGRYALCWIS